MKDWRMKMKGFGKKGFFDPISITITVGIILALTLLLGVAFGGVLAIIYFLSKYILLFIGAFIIVGSIIFLKQLNPWFISIGIALMIIPYSYGIIQDAGGFNIMGLEIVPSQQGVSLLTADGKSHFEVGDTFGKIVGVLPTGRGSGGSVEAYQVYFDGKLVGCKGQTYGGEHYCVCNEGTFRQSGNYRNQMTNCEGYQNAWDCNAVCNNPPLQIFSYPVVKDVRVTGRVSARESICPVSGSCYDNLLNPSFDFIMPVYAPKTIEKYILQNCQVDNLNSAGFCKGKCDGNICNLEVTVETFIPIDQQEFKSWKPVKGVCVYVTELGNKYFSSEQACKDNVYLQQQMSWFDKLWDWFTGLF